MKQKILRFLNIKTSESGEVFDLMFIQLFLGIATSFLTIVSYTLFLDAYPIDQLPEAYLFIAGALVVINIFYEKIEHRFSPVRMLRIISITAIVTIIMFWMGMLVSNSQWIIFILIVWGTILYMLTGYAFWGLASLLFNVRQSKRVFSIVGAGDVPAKLIGYISVALLVHLVSLENLLWFSVAAFGIAIFLVNRFVKKYEAKIKGLKISHHFHEQHLPEKKNDIIVFIFKSRLIFFISLFSLASYIIFTLVDFTFLAEVKAKFSNITQLANFIATFFGVGRLLSLILKISITSRVIAKLGLITSLFITPVVLLISCTVFFSPEGDAYNSLYMFGMMALFTEVLRSTIQEPIFFILFQPLKEHLRLKGHMIAKGYMLPPALIIVGAGLLFLFSTGALLTILTTVEVLIITILIWCVIILFIRKSYISTLHSSIKKGLFNSDEIYVPDNETNNILLSKIEGGGSIEVIYALELLEKGKYKNINNLLEQKLLSTNNDIKKYAIGRIENLGITSAKRKLYELLEHDTNNEVKYAAFDALSKLDDSFTGRYIEQLITLEPHYKKVIITQILIRRQFNELIKAGNELNNLIKSENPNERSYALDIIIELTSIKFEAALTSLLHDNNIDVRKKAMMTVAKLKMQQFVPLLISSLSIKTDQYPVYKALIQYGDDLFDAEKYQFAALKLNTLHFIKIAAKIKGPHSSKFLIRQLTDESQDRDKIINALWEKKYEPVLPAEINKLQEMLHSILKQAHEKIIYFHRIPAFEDSLILRQSLFSEVKTNTTLALKICSMLFDRNQVNRVIELADQKNNSKIYNGIEMLEIILTSDIFKEIDKLLEFTLTSANTKEFAEKEEQIISILEHIIYAPVNFFAPWTKALCIYIAGKNKFTSVLQLLETKPIAETDYVIKETKQFILTALIKPV